MVDSHNTRDSPLWTVSPIIQGLPKVISGLLLLFSIQWLCSRLFDQCLPLPGSLGCTTHLVGEEPIPLVLLGSRAIHPLEGSIFDEDRQCSEDEGCKQVQVDVVPGAVQVSKGENRACSWHDSQHWLSSQYQFSGQLTYIHIRHVSTSGNMFLSSFL